ncbi:MAG: hypothetical protein GVY13_10405 [Alphaproteobacteria bacterium]|nr:hypothetical protein [Alphaproteobacteria bacterium]
MDQKASLEQAYERVFQDIMSKPHQAGLGSAAEKSRIGWDKDQQNFESQIIKKTFISTSLFFLFFFLMFMVLMYFLVEGYIGRQLATSAGEQIDSIYERRASAYAGDLEEMEYEVNDLLARLRQGISDADAEQEAFDDSVSRMEDIMQVLQNILGTGADGEADFGPLQSLDPETQQILQHLNAISDRIPSDDKIETLVLEVMTDYYSDHETAFYQGQFGYQAQQLINQNRDLIEQIMVNFQNMLFSNHDESRRELARLDEQIAAQNENFRAQYMTSGEVYDIVLKFFGALGAIFTIASVVLGLFYYYSEQRLRRKLPSAEDLLAAFLTYAKESGPRSKTD